MGDKFLAGQQPIEDGLAVRETVERHQGCQGKGKRKKGQIVNEERGGEKTKWHKDKKTNRQKGRKIERQIDAEQDI